MIKRLIKVILAIPILVIVTPFEILFYILRWILIGESFPEVPIVFVFIFEW